MTGRADPSGHAALTICESLLLALTENKLIDAHEARGVLADAAATLRAAANGANPRQHAEAAELLEAMLRRWDPAWTPE